MRQVLGIVGAGILASSMALCAAIANQGQIALGSSQGTANFGGPDFNLNAVFEWGSGGAIWSGNLTPTTAIPVNTSPFTLGPGTLTYFGVPNAFGNPISDSTGTMITANLVGSAIAIGAGAGDYYGSFTGSGLLRQRTTNNPFAPFVVDTPWSGAGTVRIRVVTNPLGSITNFIVTEQVYTFTPEPAAYGMIGVALAGGILVARKRRLA